MPNIHLMRRYRRISLTDCDRPSVYMSRLSTRNPAIMLIVLSELPTLMFIVEPGAPRALCGEDEKK